ncbi:Brp/Blh family beta-carotene 15,15'-dioxygenase [Nonlabens ponticola]|nr:Brp/Blh family beta-carotene 15,15'-dioxygenase [Nonlabens ponticola]
MILVATLGLIHGANDYFILRSAGKFQIKLVSFISIYIAAGAAIALLFWGLPWVALNVFVLVSAYHFGEEHLHHWMPVKGWSGNLLAFFYGLSVFAILFIANIQELQQVLSTTIFDPTLIEWNYLALIPFLVIQAIVSFGNMILRRIKVYQFLILQLSLLVLYLFFTVFDLLQGFAFYFVFWHSVPSIISQLDDLKLKRLEGFMTYIKKALPFYLVSIAGIVMLYLLMGDTITQLSLVIILSAATTIPHVLLFAWQRNQNPDNHWERPPV